MNRRSFIGNILALSAAPAIVRADSLMKIVPRDAGILLLEEIVEKWRNDNPGLFVKPKFVILTGPIAEQHFSKLYAKKG